MKKQSPESSVDKRSTRRKNIARRVSATMLATTSVVGVGMTAACSISPDPNETITATYRELDEAIYLAPNTKVTLTESSFSKSGFPAKPKTITLKQGELIVDPLIDDYDTDAIFIPDAQDAAQEPENMQKAGGILEVTSFDNINVSTLFDDGSYNGGELTDVVYYPNRDPRLWTFKVATPDTAEGAPKNITSLPVATSFSATFAHAEEIADGFGYGNVDAPWSIQN